MIDKRLVREVHFHPQNEIDNTVTVYLYIDLLLSRLLRRPLYQLVSHTIVMIASLFSFKI